MQPISKHPRLKHGLLGASKYGSQSFNLTMAFSKIELKLKHDIVSEYIKRHEGKEDLSPINSKRLKYDKNL